MASGATFGTSNKNAFSAIHEVIHKLICPDSGPYGIVLWAENPDLTALKESLSKSFTGEDARLLPVFFAALKKGDYINTSTGAIREPKKLRQDIYDRMSGNPQLKALLSWEADIAMAMNTVLRSIIDLVPLENRTSDKFEDALGEVMYRISQAGAGVERAKENPREAINSVLVPILADQVIKHDSSVDSGDSWLKALKEPDQKEAPINVQASVNAAIHLSFSYSSEPAIDPASLGAVVKIPDKNINNFLTERFGISEDEFFDEIFKVDRSERSHCEFRMVQIGAPCDQAQPKLGPLMYLLAVEWPFTNIDGSKQEKDGLKPTLAKKKESKGAEWTTPIVCFDPKKNPGKISAFKNLALSIPKREVRELVPVYRFREELISQLTQEYARYISRPGIMVLGR